MQKVNDMYKAAVASSRKLLSDYPADFWKDYRDNNDKYDKLFNRMFYSFYYFMQSPEENAGEVAANFIEDVYNHLLINDKKYSELYRVQIIPDTDYSLTNNYDMYEVMDKDVTDNQDNIYGQRTDTGELVSGSRTDTGEMVKGQRTDSNTITTGAQQNSTTESVAPYDSSDFANHTKRDDNLGARSDSNQLIEGSQTDTSQAVKGSQTDTTQNVKGSQTDNLDRTYAEDYTMHRYGNIGVQTVSDMLSKHIKVWSLWEFYEYIFKEISKELLML